MTETVEFEVIGGLCRLKFQMGCSCGPDPDVNPGIGFSQTAEVGPIQRNGKFYSGMGAFSRSDAKRLADAINRFLENEPPTSGGAVTPIHHSAGA